MAEFGQHVGCPHVGWFAQDRQPEDVERLKDPFGSGVLELFEQPARALEGVG